MPSRSSTADRSSAIAGLTQWSNTRPAQPSALKGQYAKRMEVNAPYGPTPRGAPACVPPMVADYGFACNRCIRAYPKTFLMSMIEQVRWRKPWKRVLDFSQRMHSRR